MPTRRQQPSTRSHDPRLLYLGVCGGLLLLVLVAMAWPGAGLAADGSDDPRFASLRPALTSLCQGIESFDLDAIEAMGAKSWSPKLDRAMPAILLASLGPMRLAGILRERFGDALTQELIDECSVSLHGLIAPPDRLPVWLPTGWIQLDGEHQIDGLVVIGNTRQVRMEPGGKLMGKLKIRVANPANGKEMSLPLELQWIDGAWRLPSHDPGTEYDRRKALAQWESQLPSILARVKRYQLVARIARKHTDPKAFVAELGRELVRLGPEPK